MASARTRLSVVVLVLTLFQTLYAASPKILEDGNENAVSHDEKDLRPELNAFDVDPEAVRRARQTTVVFRPLFATRQRDQQRLESKRRQDEAQREREYKKAVQREAQRRLAVAAAVHRNYPQPAPAYAWG